MKFTPAVFEKTTTLKEIEDGVVIGELENELPGDESDLPAGKHNIFVTKINGEWHAYAESNGKTYKAAKAKVKELSEDEIPKEHIKFGEKGWYYCYFIWVIIPILICVFY